eukprot:tig00020892_g14919.t1
MDCKKCGGGARPSGDFLVRRLHCGHVPNCCAPCLEKAGQCPSCQAHLDDDDREALEEKLRELDSVILFSSAAARAAPVEAGYLFLVTSMDGGMQPIRLDDGATCLDLKRAVERAFRVPPQQQRLFLADRSDVEIKALRNGSPTPIADSPLKSGDTLLMLRVYSEHAGQTDVAGAPRDRHGNAAGSAFDLGVDNAFRGMVIAVLHEYTGEGFDFLLPEAALREKGFDVKRWSDRVPPLEEFSAVLDRACQLWILSDRVDRGLSDAHIDRIRRFFNEGRGALRAFSRAARSRRSRPTPPPRPRPRLGWNVVTAVYEREGRRALLDGGFTRLYRDYWDTAGIVRYVKNAAVWLVNIENDY